MITLKVSPKKHWLNIFKAKPIKYDFNFPKSWADISINTAQQLMPLLLTTNNSVKILQLLVEDVLTTNKHNWQHINFKVTNQVINQWLNLLQNGELKWLLNWDNTKMPFEYIEIKNAKNTEGMNGHINGKYYLPSNGFGNINAFEISELLDTLVMFSQLNKRPQNENVKKAITNTLYKLLAISARPLRKRSECTQLQYNFDKRTPLNSYQALAFINQRQKLFADNLPVSFVYPFFQALVNTSRNWQNNYEIFNQNETENKEDKNTLAPNMNWDKNKHKKNQWRNLMFSFGKFQPSEIERIYNLVGTQYLKLLHLHRQQIEATNKQQT